MPPSIPTTQPGRWLATSAALGAAAFPLSMALLWRDFPGLPAPEGTFSAHMQHLAMWASHAVVPALFPAQAAEWGAHLAALSDRGALAPLIWRSIASAAVACAPGWLLWLDHMVPRDGLIHVRGPRLRKGEDAVEAIKRRLRKRVKAEPDHFVAEGVRFPADLWRRHTLMIGGSGAGKSTMLLPLLKQIIAADERLICFDPKGQFTSVFGKPGIIAPWDARSLVWDIARDIRNEGDERRFAVSIVPEGGEAFWANAAREILVGLLRYLGEAYGTVWGWQELANMLRLSREDMLGVMQRHNPPAAQLIAKANTTSEGILSNLAAFTAPIFDLAKYWGALPASRRVSFIDWALTNPVDRQIIIQGHGGWPQLTKALTQGIFGTIAAILNSPEIPDSFGRKLWFVCDEFARMGKAPLNEICEMGRSRGARVVLATQDFAQLEEIHGKLVIQGLIAMCGARLVGMLSPGETADTMCKALGSREVERYNISTSYGEGGKVASTSGSWARESLPLYLPSEIANLGPRVKPDGSIAVSMALSMDGEVYELEWPVQEWPQARLPYEMVPATASGPTPPAATPQAIYPAPQMPSASAPPLSPPAAPATPSPTLAPVPASGQFGGLPNLSGQGAPLALNPRLPPGALI